VLKLPPVLARLIRGEEIDRQGAIRQYQRLRRRTRKIFDALSPEAYFQRPIALRNPFVFYEGHLPAFSVNTIVKAALSKPGVDDQLEILFARGIDPESEAAAGANAASLWPSRQRVLAYGAEADALIQRTIAHDVLWDDQNPRLRRGESLFAVLEHEPMHQETLLYMMHELARSQRHLGGAGLQSSRPHTVRGIAATEEWIDIPAGSTTLGQSRDAIRFGWDNEFPAVRHDVAAFSIQKFNVTNGHYLEFVEAGGYARRDLWTDEAWRWVSEAGVTHPHFWLLRDAEWLWRGMQEDLPLPEHRPVYATQHEAAAYARWIGARLPAEAEFHRAAYGTPAGEEREHPWGDEPPDESRGNFGFRSWDPVAVGSYPAGASAWGVHDLVGNGWEWTATEFDGFPGFEPMASYPVYSAEFFDGHHYVLKGASPATAPELIRRTFRNWFRPNYPYLYATFRCVR
jgi:iron(II)-dependent oxidoreductase